MEKAYDIKVLAENFKNSGLPILEESAEIALIHVIQWIKDSAKLSQNPYDDMALVLIPLIEIHIIKQINKIDGIEG